MLILLALVVPDLAAAFGVEPTASADPRNSASDAAVAPIDGGACGEDEDFEELIDCGSDLDARFDEPFAIAVLRKTEVRTTREQCEDLLADIWDRQTCSAEGRECGTMIPGGMPAPGPELATSSSSGATGFASVDLGSGKARRLGPPGDERMPKLRDLLPPVPPPKLAAR
jgi:hypothetical protein